MKRGDGDGQLAASDDRNAEDQAVPTIVPLLSGESADTGVCADGMCSL